MLCFVNFHFFNNLADLERSVKIALSSFCLGIFFYSYFFS